MLLCFLPILLMLLLLLVLVPTFVWRYPPRSPCTEKTPPAQASLPLSPDPPDTPSSSRSQPWTRAAITTQNNRHPSLTYERRYIYLVIGAGRVLVIQGGVFDIIRASQEGHELTFPRRSVCI